LIIQFRNDLLSHTAGGENDYFLVESLQGLRTDASELQSVADLRRRIRIINLCGRWT